MPPRSYSLPRDYANATACTYDRRAYGANQYFDEPVGRREPWQTHHAPVTSYGEMPRIAGQLEST